MGSRRRLWRRGSGGVARWPTGTTTPRAALAGRGRSRPGRPVTPSGGCSVAAVARIQEAVYARSTGAGLNCGRSPPRTPGRSLGWPGRSNWCGRRWGLRAILSTSRRATTSCQGGETVRHPLAGRKRPLDTKWTGYARSTGWHEGLRWEEGGCSPQRQPRAQAGKAPLMSRTAPVL